MFVIFLILIPNVLVKCSDSFENKYVDLLPDKEKRQFMERVAKRILETVESKEHSPQKTIAIKDEELGYQEFVSSILKEEIENDNQRRSKGEAPKDNKDEKAASQEKENIGVKPLETEKIADDPDLDQVDLTLRQDQERRGIGGAEAKSSDYINIEIDIDVTKKPIIKRSVQNDTGSEESVSDEVSSDSSENVELKSEISLSVEPKIKPSENLNSTKKLLENSTSTVKVIESTTGGSVHVESLIESSESEETIKETPEISVSVNPKLEDAKINHTANGTKNEEIEHGESKNNKSSETDGEDIQVKGLEILGTRRANFDNISNKSSVNSTESSTSKPAFEYFGSNLTDNKSEENNSDTYSDTDVEEFSTVTGPPNNTATESVPTTHTVTVQSTPIINNSISTEYITESTLTSTMTDEGTTNLEIITSKPFSDITTTQIESRTGPTRTTLESLIVVEDFTRSTTLGSTNSVLTTESISNSNKPKIYQHAEDSAETTTTGLIKESTPNKIVKESTPKEIIKESTPKETIKETTTKTNEIIKDTTTQAKKIIKETTSKANEIIKETTKKPKRKEKKVKKTTKCPTKAPDSGNDDQDVVDKADAATENPDKNFIELEKVYYNNKKTVEKEYRVYELPPNHSPFIDTEESVSEGPYLVPIYNYSSDNAYFNPTNRLGLNPDDDPNERFERVGAFSIPDRENSLILQETLNDNIDSQKLDVDMEYLDSPFDNQRKKFGGQQQLSHSIHKTPQQNHVADKKRGKLYPEDYLDSDYYFGKIRKDMRSFSNDNVFPDSNELKHTSHLKDHVRAIRTMLFQQKFFGPIGRTSPEREEQKPKKKKIKQSTNDNLERSHHDSTNNKIGLDYTDFFGGRESKHDNTSKEDKEKGNLKKVGYVKKNNDTKDLYVIDKYFKENIVKYIHQLKSKDNSYTKADIRPATPKPLTKLYEHKKTEQNYEMHRFRDQGKKRNAELIKLPVKPDKEKKVYSIAETHKVDTVKKTISINEAKDIFLDIKQMQELNLKLFRRNDDLKLGVYLEVLSDMISVDDKALKQYDWLGTTVDIQSSMEKLFELAALLQEGAEIHPADLEIINYVVFLHRIATEIIEANDFGSQLRKKLALPRNKKKKQQPRLLKEKGLINRVWLYLRRQVPEANEDEALKNLYQFLMDLEDDLFDLHDAIKNIAKVTKYRNQHWFQNLKDLYLNGDDKQLLHLLLHTTVSRFFGLIEESAKTGLEDNYVQYMKVNKKEAKRTLEELLFVMQIMDEINKNIE